jgi:hypothetical protein
VSYAIFIDPAGPRQCARALAPAALVTLAWGVSYKLLGCGFSHSASYIDPSRHPFQYLGALPERAPLLLMGQLGYPPSDLASYALRPFILGLVVYAVAGLALFAVLAWPVLRGNRWAGFWVLGMGLSLMPICAAFPQDRELLMPGLGGMALVALFVAGVFGEGKVPHPAAMRWPARALAGALLLLHLALAPCFTALNLVGFWEVSGPLSLMVSSTFPADPGVAGQRAIVVNPIAAYFTGLAEIVHALEGRPIPASCFTLASGIYPITFVRTDAQTLVVRPEGGFLLRSGTGPRGRKLPAIEPLRICQALEWFARGDQEAFPSQAFDRDGIRMEILEWTEDARPAAVSFRFPAKLEDPRWRWIRWGKHGFSAFQPPPIDQSTRLVTYFE